MGILDRFATIMKSNINALLDKCEDPEKMIDQTIADMKRDLAEVKRETAAVMANKTMAENKLRENEEQVEKYNKAINNAAKILAANPNDATTRDEAKKLMSKRDAFSAQIPQLQENVRIASDNVAKIKQMHDKLYSDIEELESRRGTIKAKMATAKSIQHATKVMSGTKNTEASMETFSRMEDKADRALAEANAAYELEESHRSDDDLVNKYASSTTEADAELDALIAQYQTPAAAESDGSEE